VCICLAYVLLCGWYFPVNEQVATFPGKWPLIGHAYKFMCSDSKYEIPVWKRSRRVLDLCFKQHILDDYLQLFNDRAERFVETLADDVGQGEVDLIQKITRSVLETSWLKIDFKIIPVTTLGVNLDGKDEINDNFAKAINCSLDTLCDRVYKPWFMFDTIFNYSNHKKILDKALETVFNFTGKVSIYIYKVNALFYPLGDKVQSVLDVILENSVNETDSLFTDVELRNFMDTVVVGAFDTTIYQMLYVLICIGSSSEVQDKIIQEMNEVLGKDQRLLRDNLSQLVYLDAVVKEAVRLYPVGAVIGRDVKTATKLRNVTIPANSSIIMHIWHINRNPKYWGPDAKEFRPERWLDSTTIPSHQAAFATFGPGKRGCVGKSYALMYLKATIVALLRKYKLTADHTKMKLECKVMNKPLSGHLIQIDKRH
ncbi:unnamed protein product, partial [Spodoptera littoralis]